MWQIIFSLLVGFSAQARWATPKDVGSVLQEYNLDYEIEKDGTSNVLCTQTWRIQTEEGKINSSLREIEYNGTTDKVELLEAKTINGKIESPVAASAIEDRDRGESRDYDATKIKSLSFPQVQVGSLLVLKYKVRSSPPPIPDQFSLRFVDTLGTMIEKSKINIHSIKPIFYSVYDPEKTFSVSSDKHNVKMNLRRVTSGHVVGEKDAYFHPARFATLTVSTEPDWAKHFAPLITEYEKTLNEKIPAPLEPEIKEWKKIKDPGLQITKILEFMSRQYRYFGDWRRVRGGFYPRHLAEIEKSRYGDCKDLSTLLTSILRQLGFNAHVSLIDRGVTQWLDQPVPKIANMGEFNHAISRAEKDGQVWWLDATNAVVTLKPFADIAGKNSFVIRPDNPGFERLPLITPDQYQYDDVESYTFNTKEGVKVNVQADYKSMAAFRLAYGFLTNPREKMLFDIVDYYSDGQELKDFKFTQASPSLETHRDLKDLHYDFIYWTPSATFRSSAGQFLPFGDGSLRGGFYETKGRESDFSLADIPMIQHSKKILHNVQGVGEPISCELKSPWIDIKRDVVYNKNDIQIVQQTTIKKPAILQKEFTSSAFLNLRDQARRCFYRTGLLFKTL
jgi:hypothetical protein